VTTESKSLTKPSKPPVWNDPTYRAIFFQLLLLVLVVGFGLYIFNNTTANLERQGIASGFGFLQTTAGFDIITHLIDYTEESTYGRAFMVSLINTLILAAIGIVLATILGVIIGIARLSPNWLIARMATVYIETIRNIPLLLQIFFWYFAVLRSVPHPRDSMQIFDTFFLNNRGLYSPAPLLEQGFWLIPAALGIAIIAIITIAIWAKRRQERTGQPFHTVWVSLGIFFGLPLLAAIVSGKPVTMAASKGKSKKIPNYTQTGRKG